MKNCIVSLSVNFSSDYLKPYIKSFIENVDSDLILLTDHDEKTLPSTSSKIKIKNIFDLIKKYKIPNLTPYNLKPVIFYLVMKELNKTKEYKNILLTDVDVIFQEDPFKYYINNFNEDIMVLAEEKKLYKDCETNTFWYKQGYENFYDKVKDKKILNCGVTIGPIDQMIDYQKKVTDELGVVLSRRNYFAYDQVILNHLTYIEKSLNFKVLSHFNDFIVHFAQEDNIKKLSDLEKNGKICNPKTDSPFVIIHQYDKNENLKEYFLNKFK
jgi:hypothetical protein